MGYIFSQQRISALTLLLSQSVLGSAVFAAGFQINEISPSLQGDATAGAAAANNDVSAMFVNPATLSTLRENQGYLGGSEILPHIRMDNGNAIHTVNVPGVPPSDISAMVHGQTYQNNISPSAFVPDGYIGKRVNDRVVIGLGINAPYGLKTAYSQNSVLRFASVYSSVKTIDVNPAISYSINEHWSVGLGFQAQYLKAKFTNFNGPYTGIVPIDALIAADYPTTLNGDGWGYGYNAGLLFMPDLKTRLGVGYRSQILEHLSGNGMQYTSPGPTVPAPSQNFLFNAQSAVFASMRTPQILTFSAARDIANWTIKASAQVNFWDCFEQLTIYMPGAFATNSTIQSQWKNTWFGALGAEFRATPAWTLRGGVAYDETPTTAFRDSRIPDADRVWVNVGATYALNKNVSIDAAYAHIFTQNQTVFVSQSSGSSATSTVPLEVNQIYADYKGSADVVALAVRYRF